MTEHYLTLSDWLADTRFGRNIHWNLPAETKERIGREGLDKIKADKIGVTIRKIEGNSVWLRLELLDEGKAIAYLDLMETAVGTTTTIGELGRALELHIS